MATGTLEGTTIASRYKSLLKLTGTGNDVLAADASAKVVEDGDGNDSALSLSTTRVGIGTASPSDVLTVHGNLKINTTNTDGNESRFKIAPGGASDDCIVSIYDDNQQRLLDLMQVVKLVLERVAQYKSLRLLEILQL